MFHGVFNEESCMVRNFRFSKLVWSINLSHILNERFQVIDIIVSYKDHDVLLGVDMLGKEELLISISNALQTKVHLLEFKILVNIHILTNEFRISKFPLLDTMSFNCWIHTFFSSWNYRFGFGLNVCKQWECLEFQIFSRLMQPLPGFVQFLDIVSHWKHFECWMKQSLR